MTNIINNKPLATLRDGSLKVSIWGNRNEKGIFYSADLVRSYTDEQGNWHDTRSLPFSVLLRAARLLELTYGRSLELRAESNATGEAQK